MDEKFVCVRHVVEDVLSSKRGEGTYVSGGARTHVASIRSNKAEDADKETLMFNVYMAGPINGCTDDEATNWREQLPKDVREACELHQDVDSDEFYFIDPMARDFRGIEGDNTDLIVHGDLMAAGINNGGIDEQLEYLFGECDSIAEVNRMLGYLEEVLS